jgi:N-acylglucosamine 2-epimerase
MPPIRSIVNSASHRPNAHPAPRVRPFAPLALAACSIAALTLTACSSPPSGDDDQSPGDDDVTVTPSPSLTPTATPAPETPTPTPTPYDWRTHLTGLMQFWTDHNLDETNGGYFTDVNRMGAVTSDEKWTRMLSRQIYGYCKAFQVTGDLTWLEHAKSGVDFLLAHALDVDHGGFRLELDAEGDLIRDERDMFSLVYALTGLAAYVEVTQDPVVRQVVVDEYHLLDQQGWDGPQFEDYQTGYFKALKVEDMTVLDDGKDFNGLVDTATAYLFTLYEATYDATERNVYKERLNQIGLTIVNHLLDPDGTGWIGENFTRDWIYDWQDGDFNGDITICGHDLKVVWVLGRLYYLTSSELFRSEAQTLLDFTLETCRDTQFGGIFDQVDRQTSHVINQYKAWWQQEQGMFATRVMGQITGKAFYDKVSRETRDFYLDHFPDPQYGEVFASVTAAGLPSDTTKGNEWKSAYHSTETAYLSLLYDAFFLYKKPVTLYYHFDAADTDRTVRLSPTELPSGTYEIDDPISLDGTMLDLLPPNAVVIPAGASGTLSVTYRP